MFLINRGYHKKCDISFFEFFELKNMISNSLLNIFNSKFKHSRDFPLAFPKEMERVLMNLERMRPLILVDPGKQLENSLNFKFVSERLAKKLLEDQSLHELFISWNFSKVMKHSEILLKYIFRHSSNKYFECDLIPAHCKSNIQSIHFKKMFAITKDVLIDFKINNSYIKQVMQDFSSVKHHICKEKTFYDHVGGASFLSPLIDHIYINLFGDPVTKNLFLNVDADDVKYKQKIFFCRLFCNKIGSHDFEDLRSIHDRLNITKKQFDVFVRSMQDYIGNVQLPLYQENEIVDLVRSLEPYIVCHEN